MKSYERVIKIEFVIILYTMDNFHELIVISIMTIAIYILFIEFVSYIYSITFGKSTHSDQIQQDESIVRPLIDQPMATGQLTIAQSQSDQSIVQPQIDQPIKPITQSQPIQSQNLNSEIFELYKNLEKYGYYKAIRCKPSSLRVSRTRCNQQGYNVVIYSKTACNAKDIFKIIKKQIPKTLGSVYGQNMIKLSDEVDEQQLLEFINSKVK